VAVIRVKQHNPSKPQALEEVANDIRRSLKARAAQQNAQKMGEQILVELRDGKTLQQASDDYGYPLNSYQGVNRIANDVDSEILDELFALAKPRDSEATTGSLINSQGDFVILSLKKVSEGDASALSDPEKQAMSRILAQQTGIQTLKEFVSGQRASAEIEKF